MIVRPTGPGSLVVPVDGRVDTTLDPASLGNELQIDGHIANVGGYASRLSTACVELASTVVDPEVIASDLAGVVGTDMDMILTETQLMETTITSGNASDLTAFVKATIGYFRIPQGALQQSRLRILAVGHMGPLMRRIWS